MALIRAQNGTKKTEKGEVDPRLFTFRLRSVWDTPVPVCDKSVKLNVHK